MSEQNQNNNENQMVEQAQQVWDKMKNTPMSVEALDKLIPMGTDFFKSMLDVFVKESEQDAELHREYLDMMKSTKVVIADALSDGVITSSERIEILKCLSEYSRQLSAVEIERIKQSGKTKRRTIAGAGLLAAIVAIVIGRYS